MIEQFFKKGFRLTIFCKEGITIFFEHSSGLNGSYETENLDLQSELEFLYNHLCGSGTLLELDNIQFKEEYLN